MMKKIMRRVALVMVLGCLLMTPVIVVRAEMADAAAAANAGQTAVATAEDGVAAGKSLMGWGVLLFAVGEVAGLLGAGVCNIRRERRRERAARTQRAQAQPLLLYTEYKAGPQKPTQADAPRRGFGLSAFGGSAA